MAKQIAKLPELKQEYDERSKYDWQAIRSDYIYGMEDADGTVIFPKPKELEEKYNVPAQYISNRATKEKWLKHREAHQNETAIVQQKEFQKKLAKKVVKFDERVADDSMTAARILGTRLRQMEIIQAADQSRISELVNELAEGTREVDQNFRSEIKPLISSYEVEAIVKAMEIVIETGHKAMGVEDGRAAITNITQIANIQSPSQALQELDEKRQEAIANFFQNKNARIPQLGIGVEDEDEIVEGELVDDPDSGLQPAIPAEASGQVYDSHSAPGSADSTESE